MTLTATTEAELLALPADDYMNDVQQQFFRELLLAQRAELQARIDEEFTELRQPDISSDVADIGAAEEQRQWQLRLLEREKKLLDKIDQALERLARGEYGWCPGPAPRFGASRVAAPNGAMAGRRSAGAGRREWWSLAKSRNAAWRHLPRNPKGRASFCAVRCCSTAHLEHQTSRLAPSPAQKLAPARPRRNGGGRPSIGEPIGLKRLLLRPTATLCIEAKERQEQREKHQRDRD